jgi:hypothetical protein
MHTALELHDSTVVEVTRRGGTVVVEFRPASLHKSEGRPGVDAGTCWVQDARLIFTEASITGVLADLPCNVMDGDLAVDAGVQENVISVPVDSAGPCTLRLALDDVHVVTIVGRSVRLELVGQARYVEVFEP